MGVLKMTEKIKDRLTSFLVGTVLVLLGFIASGIGYIIVSGDERMDKIETILEMQDARDDRQEEQINQLTITQMKDPDTDANTKDLYRNRYLNVIRGITID